MIRICIIALLLLTGCAGKSKVELHILNQVTKQMEHVATIYADGKIKADFEITKDTIKASADSKQPGALDGLVKQIEVNQ